MNDEQARAALTVVLHEQLGSVVEVDVCEAAADALLPVLEAARRDAAADAWDVGHAIGWEHCRNGGHGNDYWDDNTPNPYRAAALRAHQ